MNETIILIYHFLVLLGSAMCLAKLSGAYYHPLISEYGWRSAFRKIGTPWFAVAAIIGGILTMGGFAGVLYLIGGMAAVEPLLAMMSVVGVWAIFYGAVLSGANLAGIRILPSAGESCTSSDHVILRHYANFNSDKGRCTRCGTFVTETAPLCD